ncbi:hypothetical protein GE061_018069, partial [Apolygus lucorum]
PVDTSCFHQWLPLRWPRPKPDRLEKVVERLEKNPVRLMLCY